jgi:hypothetical protein
MHNAEKYHLQGRSAAIKYSCYQIVAGVGGCRQKIQSITAAKF